MFEQEIASIIKYVLVKSDNPTPYYDEVTEDFVMPSVYFPPPEITSRGDTLSTYMLSYSWFVKFFHTDAPSAYTLGFSVLKALQGEKNIVPLIDSEGGYTECGFMLKAPKLKRIDGSIGTAQLTLLWDSPRQYNDKSIQKMTELSINTEAKG